MGLDVSHGCWHGAYSAFMTWRSKLAEVAGLPPLELMEGFFREGDYCDPFRDFHKNWPDLANKFYRSLPIKWECLKPDVLYILLNHSDCDGEIEWDKCNLLADRLQELLPLLPIGEQPGHIGNWKDKTKLFIDGLRLAYKSQENIDFH